ncbi:MAG: pyruvate formate lyase family protein [Mycobacterium leprae]
MTKFATELRFTETYRRYQHEHPAIREAMCLRAQFPAILRPMEADDLFAGRIDYASVGFSPQDGGMAYYCMFGNLERALQDGSLTGVERAQVADMLDFWRQEATERKVQARFTPQMQRWLPAGGWDQYPSVVYHIYRMLGGYLDFDKLVQLGLPGLQNEIRERMSACLDADAVMLYDAMLMSLDLVGEVCLWYADQAEGQAAVAGEERRAELKATAAALRRISHAKPETMREAAQLAWIYVVMTGHRNFGRMDVYLGDFYVADVESGRITEAEALALVQSLWRLIRCRKLIFDGRVIVGGKGRRNPENADRFALLAMEATRTVLETEPQLTLRWHKGMNPALMEKALTVIGEGRTYPIIYNDDVNVPAVAKSFDVSEAEAEHYMPYSCGEYVLDHRSYGSPNVVINLLKALEVTLRNGRDGRTGQVIGLDLGGPDRFETFDELFGAYKQQVAFFIRLAADFHDLEHQVIAESAPFLMTSMLYDDCIARGKGLIDGTRYVGGTLESYGNTNTADSLTAIRQLVYEQQKLTMPQVIQMLDDNFAGCERERKWLKSAPKYGNDDPVADAMAVAVHEHVCNTIRAQRERTNLDYYLAVIINNSANTVLGKFTAASADGRKDTEPMANANNPSGGSDQKGVTAMLNSLVKLDPALHAGAVQNMKFSRELFTTRRPELEALLDTYWAIGGSQAMITVVSRGDLENALKEPEKYYNLFVRVGGFTARFVRMDRDVQMEVLSRTLY